MMTKMNDLKPIDLNTDLPACFRIIGIGEATADIIKTVKSYGYDYVDASVITSPFECIPTDEDRMVVILAIDNEDNANSIAKTFHDAGVLTIGLLHNADPDCYDSVDSETPNREFPAIVKAILQPIATQVEKSVQIDPCRRKNVTLFVEIRLTLGDEIKMTPVGILRRGFFL